MASGSCFESCMCSLARQDALRLLDPVSTGKSSNRVRVRKLTLSCKSRLDEGFGLGGQAKRLTRPRPSQRAPAACLARSGTKKGRACALRDQTCKERGARSRHRWLTEAAPQVMTQLWPSVSGSSSMYVSYRLAAAAADNDNSNTTTGMHQPATACAITRTAASTDWGVVSISSSVRI